MRRKQLYAIILAGALAASSAPAAVFAAEGDVAATAETSEENPVDGETAAATEAPAEETPADTTAATEAPAEQAPAQEAAAATEAPAQEAAPAEQTQQTTEEAPAVQETPAAETTEAPEAGEETTLAKAKGESTEPTAISITMKATEEGAGDKVRYFDTIQNAIDAAPEYNAETNRGATVIEVSGQIELENTVTVKENKKVCIRATNAVTISRKAGTLTADMFQVFGENAELQFDVKEGAENASLTVSGSLDEANTQVVDGSIVKVSEKGAFGIGTGVTLQDNNTTANGGAITCDGGKVLLGGGTVIANKGVKGGVYSNTTVCVKGGIIVKDNKNNQDAVANVFVELAADSIELAVKVVGAFTETASIGYTDAAPAAGKNIITIGEEEDGNPLVTADEFKTAVTKFLYDDSTKFAFADLADGANTVALKEITTPEPEPEPPKSTFKLVPKQVQGSDWVDYSTVTVSFNTNEKCKYYVKYANSDVTPKPEFDENENENIIKTVEKVGDVSFKPNNVPDGDKAILVYAKSEESGQIQTCKIVLQNRPKKAEVAFILSQEGNDTWLKNNSKVLKELKLKATHNCKYYYKVVPSGTTAKSLKYNSKEAKYSAKANETFYIQNYEVKDADAALAILAKSTVDGTQQKIVVEFKNRPSVREAKKYSVTDNKISGFENPLKFFPSKLYTFTVTEAGMDNKNAVAGDERYEYLYWSMSPEGKNAQTKKQIMSAKGISDEKEYPLYVFFQKYRCNGEKWVKVGSPEVLKTSFTSAGYTKEELKAYLEEQKEEGNEVPGYENYPGVGDDTGSGDDADAELTATAEASEKDAGSKSKSAVSTADESPIGTMSALAALSLLAGGYIVVRKRKKEEQ